MVTASERLQMAREEAEAQGTVAWSYYLVKPSPNEMRGSIDSYSLSVRADLRGGEPVNPIAEIKVQLHPTPSNLSDYALVVEHDRSEARHTLSSNPFTVRTFANKRGTVNMQLVHRARANVKSLNYGLSPVFTFSTARQDQGGDRPVAGMYPFRLRYKAGALYPHDGAPTGEQYLSDVSSREILEVDRGKFQYVQTDEQLSRAAALGADEELVLEVADKGETLDVPEELEAEADKRIESFDPIEHFEAQKLLAEQRGEQLLVLTTSQDLSTGEVTTQKEVTREIREPQEPDVIVEDEKTGKQTAFLSTEGHEVTEASIDPDTGAKSATVVKKEEKKSAAETAKDAGSKALDIFKDGAVQVEEFVRRNLIPMIAVLVGVMMLAIALLTKKGRQTLSKIGGKFS